MGVLDLDSTETESAIKGADCEPAATRGTVRPRAPRFARGTTRKTLLLAATPSLGCKLPASARIPTTPYTAVVHSLLRLSPPEARTDTSSTEPAARRCPHYRPRLPTSDTKRALEVPRSCSAAFPYEQRVLCRVLPAKVFTHVAVRWIECSVSNQCPGGSSKSSSSRKSSTAGS